ncbi:MAG: SDR family oxidoreductase [Sporocytophaga sp.]|uniref:SDR family oxidoreductase n=1 Tax=Sporocytophaga sp. TaxID=2231183 RepID=UPI001AFDC929|nr:SDR family oxidoreductase [Sporocytophaga sp.]MBO9702699.1 SDR family oxidoreductase [Sporocytophaga sp.]
MKKVIVVSGGTRGIGKAIVFKFAEEGFDVITCSRKADQLQALEEEFVRKFPDRKLTGFQADLSKKEDVTSFVKKINEVTKRIDVLVNNTGVFLPGQIHKEEEGALEYQIETNLYSAYNLTRGLVHGMINEKSGYIFNICSTASITAYTNGGSYCISKFAMYGMTKVLREEMKPYGIKVTAVLPGATLTSSWEGAGLPDERFMKPEDVADAIFGTYSLSKNTVVEEILLRPQEGDIA